MIAKPTLAATAAVAKTATALLALGVVLTLGTAVAPTPASAQGYYWGDAPAKPRKAKRRAQAARADAEQDKRSGKKKDVAERAITGPLVVSVSLGRQRLTVYDAKGPIAESPISSGRVGYSTPTGVFTVVQKKRQHYSNLYAGASMPNMQRLTWSGVALHAGALPGYPASHGCIRLPHGFSKKLFGLTSMGTRVIVTRDPVSPKSIAHDRLFAAFPPEVVASTEVKVADASAAASTGSVNAVLGVTAAAASETPAAAPSPRSAFRERRRLEAEQLAVEIRDAGYARAEKESVLTAAQKEAATAHAPLNEARADAERLEKELKDLEQAKARVDREVAALEKPEEPAKPEKKKKKLAKKKMDPAERAARLQELKDELQEYPAQAAAARTAWEAADAKLKAAETVAKEADAKRKAAMNELAEANARLQRALAKEAAAKRMEAKRNLPVSVFVSRAKKRLYVRQGWEPMFDVEVTFDRPDDPVGTHVFTALDYTAEKTAMQWNVVSVPHDPNRAKKSKKDKTAKKRAADEVAAVDLRSQTAAAALDRITIPEETREQIADVMKPGSSVVISDLPIGNETGEYTDFIVPIR